VGPLPIVNAMIDRLRVVMEPRMNRVSGGGSSLGPKLWRSEARLRLMLTWEGRQKWIASENPDSHVSDICDSSFPHLTIFDRHFGRKRDLLKELRKFCAASEEFKDVLPLCDKHTEPSPRPSAVKKNGRTGCRFCIPDEVSPLF
jgi:hypothetical protein